MWRIMRAGMALGVVSMVLAQSTPNAGSVAFNGNVTHRPIVSQTRLAKTLRAASHTPATKGGAFRDSAEINTTHVVGVLLDVVPD